jgi:hypothetical protein
MQKNMRLAVNLSQSYQIFLISNSCKEEEGPIKFHQTYEVGHQKMWFCLTYNNNETHLQLHFITFN